MQTSFLYIILAGFGLSFLVFIHEFGHYWMARRAQMKVEVFSIGFGKPFFVWNRKGVRWQICYLLFGGYVKIAGMEREGDKEPHDIVGGFYSKHPKNRIKVALMGPLVNIVFAVILFSVIYFMGGRLKPFDQFTHIIGWVDPKSELYQKGIRPGDTVINYNGKEYQGFKDLIYTSVLKQDSVQIRGERINYFTHEKASFDYTLHPYSMKGPFKEMKTIGILRPATQMIFQGFDPKSGFASPLIHSGIEKGDRIVWANGEIIFSDLQFQSIINQKEAFLTIEREGKRLHVKVDRLFLEDLQLTDDQKDEFVDWRRELQLTENFERSFFIPYEVDTLGYVHKSIALVDTDIEELQKREKEVLVPGDKIIAVAGQKVLGGMDIFNRLQSFEVLMIAESTKEWKDVLWTDEDQKFVQSIHGTELKEMIDSIGGDKELSQLGSLKKLKPVQPMTRSEFENIRTGGEVSKNLTIHKSLEAILNREPTLYLFLGSTVTDAYVIYNPMPFETCKDAVIETGRIIGSLFTGTLSPKWLSGPVGIVKIMHDGWTMGLKEALFLIGMISLNLGIVNLLPIPVLDGGHIAFSLWEWITRKRIPARIMEKMVMPFVVLIVIFFLYITYQDISRLFF